MTASRVIEGVFYAHDGQVFAFLETKRPYDIPGCAALMRRATACSGHGAGKITVQVIEHEKFATEQGFGVYSDRQGANRRQFVEIVKQLFPGCKLKTSWITNFKQGDNELLWALAARRVFSERGRRR
jgi:hypothetical protein